MKPLPSSPSRFSAGTVTSLKDSSAVSWACRPILSRLRPRSKPAMPRSTTSSVKPLRALLGVGLGHDDHQVGVDAVGDEGLRAVEDVVVALVDRRVLMPCRSLPVPGSVIAIAVIISPVQNLGSQRCFCSSVVSRSRYGAMMSLCKREAQAAVATGHRLLGEDRVVAEVRGCRRRRTPRGRPCPGSPACRPPARRRGRRSCPSPTGRGTARRADRGTPGTDWRNRSCSGSNRVR